MAKYKTEVSPQTKKDAQKVAKATQRPGQTKEQTKLIAQGVQKGIDEYKKAQKAKARELDKKLKEIKRVDKNKDDAEQSNQSMPAAPHRLSKILPWGLLALSWLYFLSEKLS